MFKKIVYSISLFQVFFIPTSYSIELDSSKLTQDKKNYTLNIENCIKIAIQNAIEILKQKSNNEFIAADLLKSYANFLPNLTTQISTNYSIGNSYYTNSFPTYVNGTSTNANFSISSDFNIFNGFSDSSSLEAYLLKQDSSEFTLKRVKQQITLDIVQNYLQIILDNKMIEIAAQDLQQSEAREKLLTAQSRLGAKSISDLYLQQAQTSSSFSSLKNLENKLRNDQLIFLKKLRLDIQKNYKFSEINLEQNLNESKFENEIVLINNALNKRLDLKASKKLALSSKYELDVSKASYFPKMDFVATATSNGAFLNTQNVNGVNAVPSSQDNLPDQLLNNMKYIFAINFSWTIFDRLATYANEKKANTNFYQIKLDEENLQNQIISEARIAFGNYKLSVQDLDTSAKRLFASQKAYQVMTGRYKVGSASFVDLMTAQSALVQAESARAQAFINYKLQNWNVLFATGELDVK